MTRADIRKTLVRAVWTDELLTAFFARNREILSIPDDEDRLSAMQDFLGVNDAVDRQIESLVDDIVRLRSESNVPVQAV